MDEILINNFMVFDDVMREGNYDLVIGDEAWEVDYYLHENPRQKRAPYVWLTDFVGWIPMPDGGEHEAFLTADYNAEMIGHIAQHPDVRDRAIFVGNPEDIVPRTFGPELPVDPRLDREELLVLRLRHRLRSVRASGSARHCARSSATVATRRSASSASAAPVWVSTSSAA